MLPFYAGARVPSWQWRLGLTLYDLLAGTSNLQRSRPLTSRQLRRQLPALRGAELAGGAAYCDAQMDDARLCLAVIQTAVTLGAAAANYVAATGVLLAGGQVCGAHARDCVTGAEFTIRARLTLNATGPWVDAVCRLAGDPIEAHLEPTKGVHIILPERGLASALLLLHPRDGRVFFVIPWLGKTLVGTTDTAALEGPDALAVAPEDVAYLLEAWRHYFQDDADPPVLGAFAGLRPLIRSRPGEPSARSREFRVFTAPSGLVSVAGGKYTTFRAMAEQITDLLGRRLGRRERCKTRRLTLFGTPAQPWPSFQATALDRLGRMHDLPEASARRLVDRYGSNVDAVIHYLNAPGGRDVLAPGEPELRGELAYQRDREMALFPEDCLLRRMRIGMYTGAPRKASEAKPPLRAKGY